MRIKFDFIKTVAICAVFFVIGSLWYTNILVGKLAEKERRLVDFWADVYAYISNNDNDEAAFLVDKIILRQDSAFIQVPAIVTDTKGNPITNNLHIDRNLPEEEQKKMVAKELNEMKSSNYIPLIIEYTPGNFQTVYYRETDELKQLRYFPYFTFAVMGVFISVVFIGFYVAQKSQQNKVWVGLARETAHQLGTPISGLMAWVELLEDQAETENEKMIAEELGKDVKRLQMVANRFSKIGSEPELIECEIAPILQNAVEYVQQRASKTLKVTIELKSELPNGFKIPLNITLFEWVIENVIKNALDALSGRAGSIIIHAKAKDQLIIDIADTGKGIHKRDIKNVFNPGFTTKKRGWGLGLSLSKRIIEIFHKGRIFVLRTEPDKGTTFRIILPLYAQKGGLFKRK